MSHYEQQELSKLLPELGRFCKLWKLEKGAALSRIMNLVQDLDYTAADLKALL